MRSALGSLAALAVCLGLLLCLAPGCSFLYHEEETSAPRPVVTPRPAEPAPTPKPTPTPTPSPEPENVNLLTGVADLSEEAVGKRPVAVMINNIEAALPQYGISEADLLFELPVEGGVTRLMALYGDYTAVPQVCSVRSCRYYFPILAAGYDAPYVYWGQDETIATDVLNTLDILRIDGMADTFGLFYRDEERQAQGYAYEHTGAFNGPGLAQAFAENGVRTDLPAHKTEPFFDFGKRQPEEPCGQFTLGFSDQYYSAFRYNEGSKLYYKEHSGKDHRDGRTTKQLCFTNVFVLETAVSVRDSAGRLDVDWRGGSGWYVSQGGREPITWEKADEYSNLVFYDQRGARLTVNPGKSYLGFLSPGSTTFE